MSYLLSKAFDFLKSLFNNIDDEDEDGDTEYIDYANSQDDRQQRLQLNGSMQSIRSGEGLPQVGGGTSQQEARSQQHNRAHSMGEQLPHTAPVPALAANQQLAYGNQRQAQPPQICNNNWQHQYRSPIAIAIAANREHQLSNWQEQRERLAICPPQQRASREHTPFAIHPLQQTFQQNTPRDAQQPELSARPNAIEEMDHYMYVREMRQQLNFRHQRQEVPYQAQVTNNMQQQLRQQAEDRKKHDISKLRDEINILRQRANSIANARDPALLPISPQRSHVPLILKRRAHSKKRLLRRSSRLRNSNERRNAHEGENIEETAAVDVAVEVPRISSLARAALREQRRAARAAHAQRFANRNRPRRSRSFHMILRSMGPARTYPLRNRMKPKRRIAAKRPPKIRPPLRPNYLECSICFSNSFEKGALFNTCGHQFCAHCILQSIEFRPCCPICRVRCVRSTLRRVHS